MARSLSTQLLSSGCARAIEAVHGESIKILSGPDQGKIFIGVVEIESDLAITSDLGADARAKVIARFRGDPKIDSQEKVQTADGKRWTAIRREFSAFLTNDFELKELCEKDF